MRYDLSAMFSPVLCILESNYNDRSRYSYHVLIFTYNLFLAYETDILQSVRQEAYSDFSSPSMPFEGEVGFCVAFALLDPAPALPVVLEGNEDDAVFPAILDDGCVWTGGSASFAAGVGD